MAEFTPALPENVRLYLKEAAANGAAQAAALLAQYDQPPTPEREVGDVAWWVDEALVWDATASQSGWWSPKAGEFVDPEPENLQLLVAAGQLLTAAEPDPAASADGAALHKLELAYELYNAVQWALAGYVLATAQTNPRTGARFFTPAGIDSVDELVQSYRDALADLREDAAVPAHTARTTE